MKRIISVYLIVVLAMPAVLEAGFTWFQAPNAPWSGRGDHTTTLFRDTIWLIGGYDGGLNSEIWCSGNGRDWILVTDSAPWGGIAGQTVTCHNDALWLIGGLVDTSVGGDTGISSAIWRSTDGRHWVKVTDSGPKIWLHAAVSYQGFLWVLGGSRWWGGLRFTNEIWRSPDGEHWTLVCEHARWGSRRDHTVTPFRDSLWLIGGDISGPDSNLNWCSGNGITWVGALPEPFWWYADHVCIEFRQKLWVIGGWGIVGPTRVVWSSENGRNWTFHDSAPWPARCGHTAVVLRDTLWIFGGYGDNSQHLNDIWYLAESGGIDEEKQIIAQIFTPTPTIIRHISELTLTEPSILLDPTGRKVVDLKSATNKNLKPGIYFLIPNTRSELRKIVLIK